MTIDIDGLVLGPCMDAFARPVVFIPRTSGVAQAQRGVFDAAYTAVTLEGEGVPTTQTTPVLGVRLSEWTPAPLKSDAIQIPATNQAFVIREVRPDGHGDAKLMLQLKGPIS
jgi:hypothetical protein